MTDLLQLVDLAKTYPSKSGDVRAVRGVDLSLGVEETLALVGESGCGKSSLGRLVVGLARPTAGSVMIDGVEPREWTTDLRRRVQMVFQHPSQSLNPRFTVEQTLDEPLRFLRELPATRRSSEIDELLDHVGLDRSFRGRLPRRLSGGEQQRVAIARALASEPALIVLDEPTSALDQSVRAIIVDLLGRIQRERHVSYLLITHDLESAKHIAHRVAVMYLGRIVEVGTAAEVFGDPQHPYTTALLRAAPAIDPANRGRSVPLRGETPDPRQHIEGCAFADRCDLSISSCRTGEISLQPESTTRSVACPVVLARTSGHAMSPDEFARPESNADKDPNTSYRTSSKETET
ncbi:MAG: oligopeptide/dipeptide ABC transporter ATP-binding protein [Ilumatobacteraceae bacterium]